MMHPHGRFTGRVIKKRRWRDTFVIIRTSTKINDKGRAEETLTEETAIGNIQPATAKMLERLPEGDRSQESISVRTDSPMTDGTDSTSADIVIWHGEHYIVKNAKNWSDYGFYHAIASLMKVRSSNG